MTATEPGAGVATVGRSPARGWIAFTTIITVGVFFQAVTAGRILVGDGWARDIHRATAGLLLVAAIAGGIVAVVRLRDRAGGREFGLMLVAMGVALLVQYGLGSAAADGKDTLWIHIPLGVALLALMMRLEMRARRIGGPT
jgi:hypothetical protein